MHLLQSPGQLYFAARDLFESGHFLSFDFCATVPGDLILIRFKCHFLASGFDGLIRTVHFLHYLFQGMRLGQYALFSFVEKLVSFDLLHHFLFEPPHLAHPRKAFQGFQGDDLFLVIL